MAYNTDNATTKGWRMFPWVPDGTYDFTTFLVRYVIEDGMPVVVISKKWVDNGGPEDVISPQLKQPWGTFPDFPPKPEKKKD